MLDKRNEFLLHRMFKDGGGGGERGNRKKSVIICEIDRVGKETA